MPGTFLALAVSLLSGFILACLILPEGRRGPWGWVLRASLAPALGLGLSFLIAFALLLAVGPAAGPIIVADLAALVILAALYAWVLVRGRKNKQPGDACVAPTGNTQDRDGKILLVGFLVLLAIGVASFAVMSAFQPYGFSDAKMIWNLRAKYLVERPVDQWRVAFVPDTESGLYGYVTEYPPLLSLSVMRVWKWASCESTLAPRLIAALVTFGTVGVLVGALGILRGAGLAAAAGIALIAAPSFLWRGTSQCADTPVGYFYLAAFAMLALSDTASSGRRGLLAAAGITCGLAALTKNDGMVFPVAVGLAWAWVRWRRGGGDSRLGDVAALFVGAAITTGLAVAYKTLMVTTTSVPIHQSAGALAGRFFEASRWGAILGALRKEAFSLEHWGPMLLVTAAFLLLWGLSAKVLKSPGGRAVVVALFLTFAAYFAYFLLVETDLQWRLDSTVDRLALHFWPIAIFTAFLFAREPDKPHAPPRKSPASKSKAR